MTSDASLEPAALLEPNTWPRVFGGPAGQGRLKCRPEDFQVDELLGFAPEGQGDFLWLQWRKTSTNSQWLARQLADHAGLPQAQVGYAGLKDRHACTSQWFSLALPDGRGPDWSQLHIQGCELMAMCRHPRPLRRGDHEANAFHIRIRDFSGDLHRFDQVFARIVEQGFPNWFGEQRFGVDGGNLTAARAWFGGEQRPSRSEQGFLLSAVRGLLFNQVLARRIEADCWNSPLEGDLMESLADGHGFALSRLDDDMVQQCRRLECSPTGPLYGDGEPKPRLAAGRLEQDALSQSQFWCQGLRRQRLRAARRPLRALLHDASWHQEGADMLLAFRLGAGSYATAVLYELLDWSGLD